MKRQEKEAVAKRIVQFYINSGNKSKLKTYNHFSKEKIAKSTVYDVIRRFESTGTVVYKKLCGRPKSVATPQLVQHIKRAYHKDPTLSVRQLAAQISIARSTLSHIKTKTLNIKARTRKTVPRYVKNQASRAKSGARFVADQRRQHILIIDDESYIPVDPKNVPGRKFYHCSDPKAVKFEVRVKRKAKFFKKYLVWQALDDRGNVSEPFITEGSITAERYLNDCLKKRLIPFINEHHSPSDILFWPDLATSHYANKILEYLEQQNIKYVPKEKNPPNLPQARPIEQFWSICKQRYSQRKTVPRNITGFKRIWKKIAVEVAREHGPSLLKHGIKMLNKIAKYGVDV